MTTQNATTIMTTTTTTRLNFIIDVDYKGCQLDVNYIRFLQIKGKKYEIKEKKIDKITDVNKNKFKLLIEGDDDQTIINSLPEHKVKYFTNKAKMMDQLKTHTIIKPGYKYTYILKEWKLF